MGVENKFERSLRAAAEELCARSGRQGYKGEVVLKRLQNGQGKGWSCDLPLRLARELEAEPATVAGELVKALERSGFLWKLSPSDEGHLIMTAGEDAADGHLGQIVRGIVESAKTAGKTKVVLDLGQPRGSLRLGQACLALFSDTLAQMLRAVGSETVLELRVDDNPEHMVNLGRSVKTRYLKELGYCSLMPSGAILDGFLVFVAREMKKKIGHTLATEYSSQPFTAFATEKILEHWREELESANIIEFSVFLESETRSDDQIDVRPFERLYRERQIEQGFQRLIHVYHPLGAGLKTPVRRKDLVVEEIALTFHPVRRGARTIDLFDRRGDILTFSQALRELGPDGLREFALDHARLVEPQ